MKKNTYIAPYVHIPMLIGVAHDKKKLPVWK